MATNEENETLKAELLQYLRDNERMVTEFREKIKDKDVIVFLGNTRSGKSTLINYMMGNELEAVELRRETFRIKVRGQSNGPIIGQGTLSCTAVPGVFKMANGTALLIDPPGFEDNRGVVQDIVNSLAIRQISYARTIKFVMVFDIDEVDADNVSGFMTSVTLLESLLVNFDKLKDSVCAIFTKEWKGYPPCEIADLLRSNILNVNGLDFDKVLVTNCAEKQQLIGIFRRPKEAGPILYDLGENVLGAIQHTKAVDVEKCEIKFSVSDRAKEALLHVYPEYTDTRYFLREIARIVEMYDSYFGIDKYVFASFEEELDAAKSALSTINYSIESERGTHRKHLKQIELSLNQLVESGVSQEFKEHFKFITLLDFSSLLDETYKVLIMANYVRSLQELQSKIYGLLDKIDAEMSARKKYNIKFGCHGAAGAAGLAALGTAVGRGVMAIRTGATVGSVASTGASIGAGTIALGVGGAAIVGAAGGAAYVLYKETIGKRKAARKEQGRPE